MTEPLKCAVCEVELTTADADHLVKTDAGPVHRECFEGPVPPPDQPDALEVIEEPFLLGDPAPWYLVTDGLTDETEAEEEARRDHGDVPLPEGIRIIDGVVCADDRTAHRAAEMVREDLATPLDPDRRS